MVLWNYAILFLETSMIFWNYTIVFNTIERSSETTQYCLLNLNFPLKLCNIVFGNFNDPLKLQNIVYYTWMVLWNYAILLSGNLNDPLNYTIFSTGNLSGPLKLRNIVYGKLECPSETTQRNCFSVTPA